MRNMIGNILPSILSVILSLFITGILLLVTGYDPIEAFSYLINGAFGNPYRISETFVKMIPIMVIALGTSVAFKAQLWNIGGNSQYTIGAIAAVVVSITLDLPPMMLLFILFFASMTCGLLFGALIGWMKAKLNANEVITTLMFDYLIALLLSYLVYGPLMDPNGHGFPQTALVPVGTLFTKLMNNSRLHSGLFVALALLLLLWIFWKTSFGFSLMMVGKNKLVAQASGNTCI